MEPAAREGTQLSVYLAGPLGFTDHGRQYLNETLVPTLEDAGFVTLDPWQRAIDLSVSTGIDFDSTDPAALQILNAAIGRANAQLIHDSQALLAVLDGSDIDSGTASEVGYAAALCKPVVGLRSDTRLAGDNIGTRVNLQLSYFIEMSGGEIETDLASAIKRLRKIAIGSKQIRTR